MGVVDEMMQIIISGLIFGCVYGLAALGMILIYKTSDVVNFAQGEMAMLTTFVSFMFLSRMGLSYTMSFLFALVFAALLGIFIYLLFMKRIQSEPHLNQMVMTLGIFLIINGVAGLIWGHQPTSFPEAVHGESFDIGGVFISPNELFLVGLTLILIIVFYVIFKYTKMGLAIRIAAQDKSTAQLMGIKVSKVFMITWITSSILGGIAGIMTAPITFLTTNMMFNVVIMAFAAAVLGGFLSLPGAFLGGLFIGVLENLVSYYIAADLKVVYTFLLIVLVLYLRPQGIFGGKKIIKKV